MIYFLIWFVTPWTIVWYRNKRGLNWEHVNQRILFQESMVALIVSTFGAAFLLFILSYSKEGRGDGN